MRIASILNEKEITLACEVFPPKHFDGIAQASAVAQEIAGLHPSFMSVAYGAAGSTPGHTIAVATAVAETGVTPAYLIVESESVITERPATPHARNRSTSSS